MYNKMFINKPDDYGNVRLLHKDVYLPTDILSEVASLHMNTENNFYSRHLIENICLKSDKSHDYVESALTDVIERLKKSPMDVFEVEQTRMTFNPKDNNWKVTKYCVRTKYDDTKDISIVFRPIYAGHKFTGTCKIVTCWLNASSDYHTTLDNSRYFNI